MFVVALNSGVAVMCWIRNFVMGGQIGKEQGGLGGVIPSESAGVAWSGVGACWFLELFFFLGCSFFCWSDFDLLWSFFRLDGMDGGGCT